MCQDLSGKPILTIFSLTSTTLPKTISSYFPIPFDTVIFGTLTVILRKKSEIARAIFFFSDFVDFLTSKIQENICAYTNLHRLRLTHSTSLFSFCILLTTYLQTTGRFNKNIIPNFKVVDSCRAFCKMPI